ncbi:MAG: DnaJ domain-containing protein [Oceanospirillaceae bacterium]|nr:DnaJ domain-containing protein [Oceanospirillaceae bacterium]
MRNPLIATILNLLKRNLEGISEFNILKALKEQFPEFNQLAEDDNLQLFRQHFLIMNALYQLQASLWHDEKLALSISALQIKILPTKQLNHAEGTELSINRDTKLAAYYLDWNEYEKTDEVEVSRLLNSFYQRMNSEGDKHSALNILKIDTPTPSKTEIKQHYRKLVKKHHPDAGGNPETFIEIRQAYEQLLH